MSNAFETTTEQGNTETSMRLGWGGVLALDRSLLDLLLREQYLQALGDLGAMDPIDVEAFLDDAERFSVSFQGLVLGAPQVSFGNAGGFSTDLTLRLNIISGEYTRVLHLPGRPQRVLESFAITEGMGYRVEAPVAIELVLAKASRFASLELDLARAVRFTTNLGPTDYVNNAIGLRLQESISYMRAYQRMYSLGRFVMDDYHPLTPEQLMVRTLPAPWGQDPDDPRHGDGAALVFMKLGIDLQPGSQPAPGRELAYPIAEDAQGLPGALILVPDIEELRAGEVSDVLRTFTLANGYEFIPATQQLGVDLIVSGSWRKGQKTVTIEPSLASVVAGQSIEFNSEGAAGPVRWSATNLRRPAAVGTFSGNRYAPPALARFVEDQQRVLVTATWPEADGEGCRHALVMESARAVQVAPRVATWVAGEGAIELRASSLENGRLEWSLLDATLLSDGTQRVEVLDQPLGDLQDHGDGRAVFTPRLPSDEKALFRVQRIRCTNRHTGDSAESAVVLIRWSASVEIAPYHVPQGLSVGPIPFTVATEETPQAPSAALSWSVHGEGEFTDNLYTPPEAPTLPIAVVTASDCVERAGYAIVEFSEGRQSTAGLFSWTAISTFELKAVSAPRCFANGWQQIEVEVTVAAADDHNGQPVEISDADLATLKFLNADSNNDLPFLAPSEEALAGKSDGSDQEDWAVNRYANGINRQVPMAAEPIKPLQARTRRFFLHSRKPGMLKVIASIANTLTGNVVRSEALGEKGKLELHGLDTPSFTPELYSFRRIRVAGDTSPSEGDEFAYVDRSTDNWLLEHVVREGRVTKFARLFIKDADNKSGVRWSWKPGSSTAPVKDDDFVSYTGFSFQAVGGEAQSGLLYDGLLYRMARQRGYSLPGQVQGTRPGAGQLLIVLKRDTDFVLSAGMEDPAYRHALEGDLIFTLLDVEGNEHPLAFAFAVTAEEERQGITHRDVLKLAIR